MKTYAALTLLSLRERLQSRSSGKTGVDGTGRPAGSSGGIHASGDVSGFRLPDRRTAGKEAPHDRCAYIRMAIPTNRRPIIVIHVLSFGGVHPAGHTDPIAFCCRRAPCRLSICRSSRVHGIVMSVLHVGMVTSAFVRLFPVYRCAARVARDIFIIIQLSAPLPMCRHGLAGPGRLRATLPQIRIERAVPGTPAAESHALPKDRYCTMAAPHGIYTVRACAGQFRPIQTCRTCSGLFAPALPACPGRFLQQPPFLYGAVWRHDRFDQLRTVIAHVPDQLRNGVRFHLCGWIGPEQ